MVHGRAGKSGRTRLLGGVKWRRGGDGGLREHGSIANSKRTTRMPQPNQHMDLETYFDTYLTPGLSTATVYRCTIARGA